MKRWPLNKVWFWETSPFLRLLLPMTAGILVYSFLPHAIYAVVLGILFIAFTSLLVSAFFKGKWPKLLFPFAMHILVFSIAWLLCWHYDIKNNSYWLGADLNQPSAYSCVIIEQPVEKERTWKIRVKVLNAISESRIKNVEGDAFVYLYKDNIRYTFSDGDTLLVPDKWQLIKNSGNPFEFDYARYCARNNIYHCQFLGYTDILQYKKGTQASITWYRRIHYWSVGQLARFIQDIPTLGLIQAMLVGEEANLDSDLRQAYIDTGIIHVIAISGSHIAIFFVFIAFLLGWIKHRRYNWLKYIIALPLIWGYVLIAGAPPSAVRAALMFSILAVGFALQKSPNSINQLCAAAFLLLCAQPMWLFSVGFQLSFIAVLSLILFYRPVYLLLSPVHIVSRMVWGAVSASIAAEILIAPLVIYYFHLLPVTFILANVLAYLFMGIVLVAGMLIIALSFMPFAAMLIGNLTSLLVQVFNNMIYWLQQFNPQSFYYLHIKGYELLALYIAIISFAVFVFRKKMSALFIGLITTCLILLSFCINEYNALRQKNLVVYNISKANHIELIEGKYHKVIATDTTVSNKKKHYALKPAHTAWHAWQQKAVTQDIFNLGDKSVLVLNQPSTYTNSFPVDYLIINYAAKDVNPVELQKIFKPRKIILASDLSRRKNEEWVVASRSKGIRLHSIMLDGAFIIHGF